MTIGWQGKLASCFFAAAGLCAFESCRAMDAAAQESRLGGSQVAEQTSAPALAAPRIIGPYCPSGWVVVQRHDDRRADGVITRATWIPKCLGAPKVKWHKRKQQIRRM